MAKANTKAKAKAKAKAKKVSTTVFEENRKARFNYEILETYEAGMVLLGSEVKAIRAGKISLKESYCQFVKNELFLQQAHVGEFVHAHARNHSPLRPRKLLLNRKELDALERAVNQDGLTIVPISCYLKERHIKLKIGLARGKKIHDKRASIKEREQKREVRRAIKDANMR